MISGLDQIRRLLLELGDYVRQRVRGARGQNDVAAFADVSRESVSDTICGIDRISEEAIAAWFADHWPVSIPVELVMEGNDPENPVTFPTGVSLEQTEAKIIPDPIDGTRGIMYDKRAAWFLAGLAPQRGAATRLSEIEVAAGQFCELLTGHDRMIADIRPVLQAVLKEML